jgi:predicted alpha/beta superfamily hydrolase
MSEATRARATPEPAATPFLMSIEPSRRVRAAAFDWDYEVQVALPPSYASSPETTYPVLWVTDGPGLFHLAVGVVNVLMMGKMTPEVIIVGVGCPSDLGLLEFGRRRATDFAPPGKQYFFDGPGADLMKKLTPPDAQPQQKGDDLLAFLIDDLRPALARDFRMDDDHCLFGHSGGGMFASYAIFARPGGFRRYIIGSPSSNAGDRAAFRLEEAYAAQNTDLKADLFFGAGEKEIGQLFLAAWGLVSAPVLMAETLLVRQYPSLKITTRIFPGKDHLTVLPDLLLEGVLAVWADRAKNPQVPSTYAEIERAMTSVAEPA